jgi:hypothetical protein
MKLTVENESSATAEAVAVLMEQMPASKVARILSSWQLGTGDYVAMRDQLFANTSVEQLLAQAQQKKDAK